MTKWEIKVIVYHNEDWMGKTEDGTVSVLAKEIKPKLEDDYETVVGGSFLSRKQLFQVQETASGLGMNLETGGLARHDKFTTSDPDKVNQLLKYTYYANKFGTPAKNKEGKCWLKNKKVTLVNVKVEKAYWLNSHRVLRKGQTISTTIGYNKTNSKSNNTSESTTLSVEVSADLPFGDFGSAKATVGSTKNQARSRGNTVSMTSSGTKSETIRGPGRLFYLVVELSNKKILKVVPKLMDDGKEPKPLSGKEVRQALLAMDLE